MSNFVLDDIIEEPKERRRGWNDRTEEEKIQLTKSLYVSFYGSYLNKINLFRYGFAPITLEPYPISFEEQLKIDPEENSFRMRVWKFCNKTKFEGVDREKAGADFFNSCSKEEQEIMIDYYFKIGKNKI